MPGTVTVACKVPNGILLQIYEFETRQVSVMAGGLREVKIAKPLPWSHRLNGPAKKLGQEVGYSIIQGAALTHGVDADNFAIWMSQRKGDLIVKNGLVFAHAKPESVAAQAAEHRDQRSDFEPIDPKNLPPEFRNKIEPATAS
jgi:hypothetical protein